jgi:hypothetical protein
MKHLNGKQAIKYWELLCYTLIEKEPEKYFRPFA